MGNKSSRSVIYQRILVKFSGESLQGDKNSAFDSKKLFHIASEIESVAKLGIQVAIVMGGGNLIRGTDFDTGSNIDRITADQMGMLATIINGLALRDVLSEMSLNVSLMSAIAVPGLVNIYNRNLAKDELQLGKIVIFVGGTGNPLVTTDSAAALRGIELDAEIVLKATKVNGVFAADPVKNPKAQRYQSLTYDDVLEQRLGVMDLNAILLCKDNNLPLRVFDMNEENALKRIVTGEEIGTLIKSGG